MSMSRKLMSNGAAVKNSSFLYRILSGVVYLFKYIKIFIMLSDIESDQISFMFSAAEASKRN